MRKKIFYIFEGKTLAYALAKKLLLLGNRVYYVSKNQENIEILDGLKAYHSSLELIQHDPTDINWIDNFEMTKDIGAVILLSEDDAQNFVISWILRQKYDTLKILSLVNHVENKFVFDDIDTINILPTLWMEKVIESTLKYEDITDFFNPYVDKLSILELTISKKDKSCNKPLKELRPPENSIVGVIIKKNGEIMVPQGNTIIEAEDKLIVFSIKEQVQKVKDALK